MKAEERHELKENDLVTWVQYGLPLFLRRNGSYLLLAAALCLLGYQVYNYYERKQEVDLQNAWTELQIATTPNTERAPDKLDAIIRQYSAKSVQAQAYLGIADFYLLAVANGNPPEGFNGVKATQKDSLDRAEQAATTVVQNYPDQTLAVGKAHLLLAAVALDRHEWDAAKKQYAILTEKSGPFAGSAFVTAAQSKLDHLEAYQAVPEIAMYIPPTTSPSSGSFDMMPSVGPTSRP